MALSRPHRYLNIVVRTLHIAAAVGTFVAVTQQAQHQSWAILLILTGTMLCMDELWRYGADWLRYTQAWVIISKISAFTVIYGLGYPQLALWTALVLGSLIAHAPGELRHQPLTGQPGPCARKNL